FMSNGSLYVNADYINGGTINGITITTPQAGIYGGIAATVDPHRTVRMYAGSSHDTRNSAPFMVLQNGDMYASNAIITGGRVEVGSAGMTNFRPEGVTNAVRMWAGASYVDSYSAPFRVYENG